MIRFLQNTLGLGSPENRRKYDRYMIVIPIELTVDGENFQCEVENVSAGGLRLTPALEVEAGATVTVTVTILHPQIRIELGGNRGLGLGAHAARGSVVVRLG